MKLNTTDFPYMDKNFKSYRLISKADPTGKYITASGYRYSITREYK